MVVASSIGTPNHTLAAALAYVAAGLSVIPVRSDGSKAPRFEDWREFSDRRPTDAELYRWFARGNRGVGIPGGSASGHLVVFDFEAWHAFTRWGALLAEDERNLLARCPVVGTPSGGAHAYLRLTESVRGSKYAKDAAGKCLIETRGDGHFVVAPGSPPGCHRTGRPYRLVRPGWLDGGRFDPIPVETFHPLTLHAAALNEYRRPAPREVVGDRHRPAEPGDRPGDHFNARVSWTEILTPHGWTVYRPSPGVTYWCRPEKNPPGVSASTGFCRGPGGNDLLYVFSTSAAPFEAEVGYSRFAAYALLNHRGDFRAATRALGLAGYGAPAPEGGAVVTPEDITLTVTPAAGKPGRFVVEARAGAVPLHRDTFDLNGESRRTQFVKHTLKAAGSDEKGANWAALAKALDRRLLDLAAAPPGDPAPPAEPAEDDPRAAALDKMPDDVRAAAEELLDDPDLMRRIRTDIRTVGVVGEFDTALLLYLIGASAQLDRPLAGIVRGPSSSGKSFVVERVTEMFPPEVLVRATDLTPNALYYFPPGFLRHKWVVAGERSRADEDERAEATRALREMIESGKLSKAVPQKTNDRMATEVVEQEGPIAFVETTTLANIFDEDANRCLLLSTDEREEQTRRVLAATAEAAAGRGGRDADRVRAVHHAVQRMLPRCDVVVPFADAVSDLYPAARIESRRDFRHLIQLVKAVALLHFRQRQKNAEGKIVATLSDYEDAEQLARGPLGAAAGGVSEAARRFLDTLREKFRDGVPDSWREFTTTDAKALHKSRSPIYAWLGELNSAGAVEQTQPGKGRTPARWRLVRPDECPDLGGSGIPSADAVRERVAERTRGREQ